MGRRRTVCREPDLDMTRSNRSRDGRIVCRQAIPSSCGDFAAASDRHRRIESTQPQTGAAERWRRLCPTLNFEPSDIAAAATRLDLVTKTARFLLQDGEHKESRMRVG